MKKFFLCALLLTGFQQAPAFCLFESEGPHRLYLGPECYYSKRSREGGSEQTGYLFGAHMRYERVVPWGLYWALDGYADVGPLSGKSASGRIMKSTLSEYEIEGRAGYTLYIPQLQKLLITPYGIYSYYYSLNKFRSPSPIHYTLHDRLQSGGGGICISITATKYYRMGVDFSAKYILKGTNKVTNDPDFNHTTLEIDSKWQYEVDFPIEFCRGNTEIRFIPFYRLRHLGGKPNYPFDFIETKYTNYGARMLFQLSF